MPMHDFTVIQFWNRVDSARKGTLEDMSNKTGISEGTLRNLRCRKMFPNLTDTVLIADYLGVTLDWLVLGKVSSEKEEEVSSILKAYLDSDEVTKLLVKRTLMLI